MNSISVLPLLALLLTADQMKVDGWILDFMAPPSKFDALVAGTDVILVGEVINKVQGVTGLTEIRPTKFYGVRPLQVLKGTPSTTSVQTSHNVVQVAMLGGSVVINGIEHTVDDSSFDTIVDVGQTAVWFLAYERTYGAYTPRFGWFTVFKINRFTDEVQIPRNARHIDIVSSRASMPLPEFLSRITR